MDDAMSDKQKDLYSLSNQMVEIFIKNLFAKNNIDANQIQLSDEQKESLKQSFYQLKEQVDNYVSKHTTEEDMEAENKKQTLSPLRERYLRKRQQQDEGENEEK